MDIFWEMGFQSASITHLTEAMGISAQSLYAAFGSKEALYREAMNHYVETIGGFGARALAEETTAFAGLARILREAAVLFTRHAAPRGCMITTAPAGTDPEFAIIGAFGMELRERSVDAIAARIQAGIDDGELPESIHVRALARYLVAVIQGMSVQARDGVSRKEITLIAEQTIQSLLVLLR